jgi:serine/threonine protein kinase
VSVFVHTSAVSTMTEMSNMIGQVLGQGRYHVKRKLGEGGMAFVLLAADKNVGIDVVLKVPKPAMFADPEFAHRFKREIRSMVELTHPHIVKIKDVGEHEGVPFYVMDLLTGGSLEDRFERISETKKKPMSAESLADWLAPVARALDFIHQRFVHRDVKPANILFDSYGNAFVSDFGIVKAISDGSDQKKQTMMTQAGMVIGTGSYMAPEVTEGKKYDGRADQYALAATVYEALTGRVPFDGPTLPAIIMQQLSGKIPPLHQVVPTLPKDLTQVVEKGLSLDPKNRYANCNAFANAVLAAIRLTPGASAPSSKTSAGPKAVCPVCKKAFALPADPAGKSFTCPACGAAFTVTKKTPDQALKETSRSSLPREETQVAPRKETASQSGSSQGTSASQILDLSNQVPRRVWIGIAVAIVLGLFGLLAVVGIVSAIIFWRSGGPRNERKDLGH